MSIFHFSDWRKDTWKNPPLPTTTSSSCTLTGVARCVPNDVNVRNAVLRLRGVSCGSSLVNIGHICSRLWFQIFSTFTPIGGGFPF